MREGLEIRRRARGSPAHRLPKRPWGRLGAPLIFLGLWEGAVRGLDLPPYLIPTLSSVLVDFGLQLSSGDLLYHIGTTVGRSVAGILAGGVLGVGLGLLMGWYSWMEQGFDFLIAATYPLPKIALIPLLVVWMGIGEMPRLVMALLGAFYPILINTVVGVKGVDPILIKAARDMGASDHQLFREVMLPGSLPVIFAGLKLGAGISFILVVASEMLFGESGVGFLVQDAASILRVDRVFMGLLVLCGLGILLFQAVDALERIALPWHIKTS